MGSALQATNQVLAFVKDSRGDARAFSWQLLGGNSGCLLAQNTVQVCARCTMLGVGTTRLYYKTPCALRSSLRQRVRTAVFVHM